MTDHQTELVRYLEMMRKMRGETPPEGYTYAGLEDFLIREGTWYEPRPLPSGISTGTPRCCFQNALVLAILHGFAYIEGLAVPDIGIPLPALHAWNLTPEGQLVDNTWADPGLAYIGVPFTIGRADRSVWFDNASVLDNPRRAHDIYRFPWHGEKHILWPTSPYRKKLERMKQR